MINIREVFDIPQDRDIVALIIKTIRLTGKERLYTNLSLHIYDNYIHTICYF